MGMTTAGPELHGAIDRAGDIAALDLVAFNDGRDPFGNPFIQTGFEGGAAYHREVIDHWKMRGLGRIADLGSGYGRWTMFLAEANTLAIGYERNKEAVELSRRLAAYFAMPNAQFEVSDILAIDADAASFDAAWCYGVLHLLDRGKLFREAHRIIRPGGILLVGVYNGVGRILEKLFASYRSGGVTDRVTQFALRSLRQGPMFNDGNGNYGSPEHIGAVLDQFGFDLDPTRPLKVGRSAMAQHGDEPEDELDDLAGFADRFAADTAFADKIVANPQIAARFPRNLYFGAIRR